MANVTVTVLEADGTTETDVVLLDVGRQAAAASKSLALSTEDKTALDAVVTAVQLIDNAVSGNELQVDVVAALPAGTNNIGDVDVLSIVPGTAATNLGKAIDTATGATDTGVLVLATRDDALSALTPVEGDNIQLRVDANGALWVIPYGANGNGQGTAANSSPVVEASDSVLVTSIPVDDAAVTAAAQRVQMVGFFADETATDSVDEGDGGMARMTLDRKQIVTAQPHTAGGLAIHLSIDLDEGTLEVVKNAPGQVYSMWAANTATSTRFIKFYDATSGTAGTGTPVVVVPIPGNSSDDIAGVFNSGSHGIAFGTGICVGATTGVAHADTGAPGANEVIVNIFYK
jgi:hypothetical protein